MQLAHAGDKADNRSAAAAHLPVVIPFIGAHYRLYEELLARNENPPTILIAGSPLVVLLM